MAPKKPGQSSDDLFRNRLEAMIDMDHPLVKLAGLVDWSRFDVAFGRFYTQKGRPGLPTRLMPGLHLLKHMRSEENTSELQSLTSISYAVFCLQKKNIHTTSS